MEKHKRDDSIPVWLYAVGFGLLVYLFLFVFQFVRGGLGDVLIMGLMQFGSIGLHEGSHMVMMAVSAPFIVIVAAGTVGQVGFVLICLAVALWRKAYFAAAFVGLWLSYSLRHTGIYMNDALAQELPFVTPVPVSDPGQAVHDWAYMFGQWGLMPHYKLIGDVTIAAGFGVGVMSVILAAYAIVRLWRARSAAQ